jgi:hypothetical protein
MSLLYNLEKAGLVKRQVSQSSFSMNMVFFSVSEPSAAPHWCFILLLVAVLFTSISHNIISLCAGIEE